ncbi:hypothetical protein HETIRDRAFT_308008 [Heterobasidion irregulare TC 32-1]|uniref:Pyridoxamine 5'-phosphate oxidase Alr4036 family FMN-binding domain-containing protein n=1 Tax=Heterobasidion irregulare (strain TC 32-1) TaxID=747525 RepID=W4KNS8_HETIT|nr:uncharacterized protein HETIRDRAFT_308008 [Heterobasidion irregulare TC 32-1]ETW86706.1 hypothetical protein HETIRDRAFT_308008 [Heterobasidion irregulare TC 32-1]
MTSPPRWFTALSKVLNEHDKSSLYQLATVDSSNKPHVRSHIHRGFLVPPSLPALLLLLTNTDSRTEKTTQIAYSDAVELAWWIGGSSDQFRISGRARVVSAPERGSRGVPAHDKECSAIASLDAVSFDWEAKRREAFNAISERMRASFCHPEPGGYGDAENWVSTVKKQQDAQTDEEKKNTEVALSNFALVVIEPFEVDWVQMGIVPNQRTRFWREGNAWKDQAVARKAERL